ncbi:hypothetical protein GCM10009836_69100 [Pseudonocardia ailaonensis]|uniref:Helix-turn-helix domain-containing protein n=1 Tax=Pseudonocardia ailaonensis TaxID=367279 RepID=A0ABN2NNL7_9PSEU
MIERPWNRRETAEFLGVSEAALVKWAGKANGPPYRVIGVHARYLPSEVLEWLRRQPTRGSAPAA